MVKTNRRRKGFKKNRMQSKRHRRTQSQTDKGTVNHKPFKCVKSLKSNFYDFGLEEDVFDIDTKDANIIEKQFMGGGGNSVDSSLLLPKNNYMAPLPNQSSNIPIPSPFTGSTIYNPANISTWTGEKGMVGGGDYYKLNQYSKADISRMMKLNGGSRKRKMGRMGRIRRLGTRRGTRRGGGLFSGVSGYNNTYNEIMGKALVPTSNPITGQLPRTHFGKGLNY